MKEYLQEDNIKYIIEQYGKTQWVQIAGRSIINNADAAFWCGLIKQNRINEAMNNLNWDVSYTSCYPGLSSEGDYYKNIDFEKDIEQIVYYREFHGIRKDYVEISQEFILLNNLFYDEQKKIYYSVLENGELDEVIKLSDNNVQIKLKYLKKFASCKQMAVLLFFDIMYISNGTLEENGLSKLDKEYKTDDYNFDILGDNYPIPTKSFYSRLYGKKIIKPNPLKDCGYWPYENEKNYEDFIIGIDENGEDIYYSSNPDKLNNYYGDNPGCPSYFTPVFFKKDVLDRYIKYSDIYKIEDSQLICGKLWSLEIDNNHKDLISAFLGDIGKYLPELEYRHWKSYNISSDIGISKTTFMRDF